MTTAATVSALAKSPTCGVMLISLCLSKSIIRVSARALHANTSSVNNAFTHADKPLTCSCEIFYYVRKLGHCTCLKCVAADSFIKAKYSRAVAQVSALPALSKH